MQGSKALLLGRSFALWIAFAWERSSSLGLSCYPERTQAKGLTEACGKRGGFSGHWPWITAGSSPGFPLVAPRHATVGLTRLPLFLLPDWGN